MKAFWRGWLPPLMALPLLPATLFNLFAGRDLALLGCVIGMVLPLLASWLLRRGREGDAGRAALAMGGAAVAVAALGAEAGPVAALLLGAGAWGGARLLYTGMEEGTPVAPPPPPEALREARARLAAIIRRLPSLPEPRLMPVASAIGGVLDDLERRPERLAQARDALALHLDALERIVARLEAGAAPPPGLAALLTDLETGARGLRDRLREEESAALEVQVKVLGERLRREGLG
ncbi:Clp protease/crotonase-like domain-containing protein [Neoroseomonas soli]|uniref:Uncharacterized protein n=1 Tax=Neoroseomonas soli TaxID=1081025 RepID=A0A9X9WXH8_9PROT|nr:hypothetical protein [Neoroseomonas soli]MBR0671857.1 hypothetical protein [Neoroseomonas soli]